MVTIINITIVIHLRLRSSVWKRRSCSTWKSSSRLPMKWTSRKRCNHGQSGFDHDNFVQGGDEGEGGGDEGGGGFVGQNGRGGLCLIFLSKKELAKFFSKEVCLYYLIVFKGGNFALRSWCFKILHTLRGKKVGGPPLPPPPYGIDNGIFQNHLYHHHHHHGDSVSIRRERRRTRTWQNWQQSSTLQGTNWRMWGSWW